MAVKTSWAAGDVLTAADLTDTFAAKAPLALSINAQTGTSYTLAVADSGSVVTMTNAAASTVTIPTNASVAVPIGSSVEVVNLSTGVNTTVSAAGGVTFNGGPVVLSPGSSVTLVKIGTDAWMAQGQGSPGMVHIASGTVSSATTLTFNNCFSSAYENYRIVAYMSLASAQDITYRLRVSGSDDSTSNYQRQLFEGSGATVSSVRQDNGDKGFLAYATTAQTAFDTLITQPFLSGVTTVRSAAIRTLGAGATAMQNEAGGYSANKSFTGITIFSTANMTGTVRIYGMRD